MSEKDEKVLKLSTADIVKLMPKDEPTPIKQIIYVGKEKNRNPFKEKHKLEDAGFNRIHFIIYEENKIETTYLYGFNDALIVVEDSISITVTEDDQKVLDITRSKIVKEREFPYKWFEEYFGRIKRKQDTGFKNRFELMELS
jgi:hypothetical protein